LELVDKLFCQQECNLETVHLRQSLTSSQWTDQIAQNAQIADEIYCVGRELLNSDPGAQLKQKSQFASSREQNGGIKPQICGMKPRIEYYSEIHGQHGDNAESVLSDSQQESDPAPGRESGKIEKGISGMSVTVLNIPVMPQETCQEIQIEPRVMQVPPSVESGEGSQTKSAKPQKVQFPVFTPRRRALSYETAQQVLNAERSNALTKSFNSADDCANHALTLMENGSSHNPKTTISTKNRMKGDLSGYGDVENATDCIDSCKISSNLPMIIDHYEAVYPTLSPSAPKRSRSHSPPTMTESFEREHLGSLWYELIGYRYTQSQPRLDDEMNAPYCPSHYTYGDDETVSTTGSMWFIICRN